MSDKYILDSDGEPIPCHDLMQWTIWFQRPLEKVVYCEVVGTYTVSTVFIGKDYSLGKGRLLLWETMIIGEGPLNYHLERCGGNRNQAEAMHANCVKLALE